MQNFMHADDGHVLPGAEAFLEFFPERGHCQVLSHVFVGDKDRN